MDISLSPDNEKFIQSQIAAGIYKNINDAINAAINLVIVDNFNKEVEIGLDAMQKGDVLDGQKVIEEFRKKYA